MVRIPFPSQINLFIHLSVKLINWKQWLIRGALGLFVVAATMKALSLIVNFPGSSTPDKVLWFLPTNALTVLVIGLEVWIVSLLLNKDWLLLDKFVVLFLLSSCFLSYRAVGWFYFGVVDCGCFGLPKEGAVWSAVVEVMGFAGISVVFLGSLRALWPTSPSRCTETVSS
ncbi:MAG: hypothetical protein M2R46_01615 [Verrucomicrobia subdivision 3 bacterium]|nr:hypothetical protein [Limisphaerales bacterium]